MTLIVAGFGFRAAASPSSLWDALERAQVGHPAVTLLAAPTDKAVHLEPMARTLGLPIVGMEAAALEAMDTPTRSLASLAARQTGSVAEAVALAAAGPGARLLSSRHISSDRMATCAIAQGASS